MVKVLKPFEVRAGDTTTIDKHVGGGDDSSSYEDLLGGVSRGAVGALEDGLDLDVLSVTGVEGFLSGGGDHAVSLLEEEGLWVLADGLSGVWVGGQSSMLDHEVLNLLHVQAVGVVDSGVVFNYCGDLATVLLNEFGGPVADGAKALHDKGLILDAGGQLDAIDE